MMRTTTSAIAPYRMTCFRCSETYSTECSTSTANRSVLSLLRVILSTKKSSCAYLAGSTSLARAWDSSREAADRVGFVFVNVEYRVELGDLQQILDPVRQSQQLQMATLISDRGVGRDQLADSRTVDIRDVLEIQKDVFVIILHQVAQRVAQRARPFPQRDPPRHVDHGDVPYLPSGQLYAHVLLAL